MRHSAGNLTSSATIDTRCQALTAPESAPLWKSVLTIRSLAVQGGGSPENNFAVTI
jgi:hypothetical protein